MAKYYLQLPTFLSFLHLLLFSLLSLIFPLVASKRIRFKKKKNGSGLVYNRQVKTPPGKRNELYDQKNGKSFYYGEVTLTFCQQ